MKRGRPAHPDILTPREWEVLALVAEGLTNGDIAVRLGITERGARYHVSEILSKLGLEGREAAAQWWREQAGTRSKRGAFLAWLAPVSLVKWPAPVVGVMVLILVVGAWWGVGMGRGDGSSLLPGLSFGALSDTQTPEVLRERYLTRQDPGPGQVLYMRVERFERRAELARWIEAATGIPGEELIIESWQKVDDDGRTLNRVYSRRLTPDGKLISETFIERDDPESRTIWHTRGPVSPGPQDRPTRYINPPRVADFEGLEERVARQQGGRVLARTQTEVVVEHRTHVPAIHRVVEAPSWRTPDDSGLAPVEWLNRETIRDDGLQVLREIYAVTEAGAEVLIGRYELTHFEVLDEMPDGIPWR